MADIERQTLLHDFGLAVRDRRHALGLTQEQVALRSDLDITYISGIERGKRNVSIFNIAKIALVLEISLSDLFASVPISVEPE